MIWDLLTQGKFLLPVQRDEAMDGALRFMRRYEDSRKQVGRLRSRSP